MHLNRRWLDRRVYEYFAVTVAPWFNWRHPVLIYQMGKVGSSSIRNSLFRRQHPGLRPVLMSHEYFPIRTRDPERTPVEPQYRQALLREIEHDRRVFQQFPLRKRLGWRFRERCYAEQIYRTWVRSRYPLRVITLVREPVANNVSMFFQIIDQYLGTDLAHADCSIDALIDVFIAQYTHSRPLTWLDAEVKTHFGIDVFEHPFPVEQGYTVINRDRISLLVLRVELDDRVKAQAIGDFLGLDNFELVRSNVASQKSYAAQYAQFRDRVRLPAALLEQMYESRYARHFYSAAERAAFRARWSGASGPA
ncbi:MAG: putative capsular polysaccharide synthesis family protein [Pseudomonadota bacterium]